MNKTLKDISDRIDELKATKAKAQASIKNMKHGTVAYESWAGRIMELAGRIEELQNIYYKLEKLQRHV